MGGKGARFSIENNTMTTTDDNPEPSPGDDLRSALARRKHKLAGRLVMAMEPAEVAELLRQNGREEARHGERVARVIERMR